MSIPAGLQHPPQRSFKPRRRGLSAPRLAAYERSMERWGITVDGDALSFVEIFGAGASGGAGNVVLDIGFGGGEALIELAETRPHETVVGIDVHTPGIAAVLIAVEARGLRNVRVVEGDVLDFVRRIPAGSIAAIRVFFPDPWPKRRQRGRRLIRPEVVDEMVRLLRDGGSIHLATDDAGYAAQMRHVCDAHGALYGGPIPRPPWRPVTRYEQRALDEGRPAADLAYRTSDSSPNDSSSAFR
ncbi:MAG: tRNA (guanosine(46)-N7)-methyltransferase TrmB [Ilumatobacteraceae bacterium]